VKNLTISRRYAKALLLIGQADGGAEAYRKELAGVSNLIAGDKALEQVISNPLYDMAARKKVLKAVIGRLELSKVMQSFLLLLFDKGRIGVLSSISDFYQRMADELKGMVQASVISATKLSSDSVEKIRSALSKKTGKEVVLEVKQDAGLIGGVVTRIGDLVLDGSIKTQLLNMRESLKRGERV
jgi:F-type H+-transporting ATPase subunit delta